jgi:hypothetical protein
MPDFMPFITLSSINPKYIYNIFYLVTKTTRHSHLFTSHEVVIRHYGAKNDFLVYGKGGAQRDHFYEDK